MAEDPENYYSKRSVFVSKLIFKNITDRKNSLEGACGAGLLSLILAQNGFDVYGYDISSKMIESSHKLLSNNMHIIQIIFAFV